MTVWHHKWQLIFSVCEMRTCNRGTARQIRTENERGKLCDSPVFPLGQYECGRGRLEEKSLCRVSLWSERTDEGRLKKAFIC